MSAKVKVYELAKKLDVDNTRLLEITKRLGIDAKNSMSVLGTEEIMSIKEYHEKNAVISNPKPPAASGGKVVTEKRVGSRVIRRRA